MKIPCATVAAITLASIMLTNAQDAAASDRLTQGVRPAAVSSRMLPLYRIPGVRDNGGAENTGTATIFHCTSFNNVNDSLRIQILNFDGAVVANQTRTIVAKHTLSIATHGTFNTEDLPHLSPGVAITQGYAAILATSTKVICSAVVVDAAAATPTGHTLNMVRSNAFEGTQE